MRFGEQRVYMTFAGATRDEVQRGLAQDRRSEAVQVCQRMQEQAPEHRLALTARRAVTGVDVATLQVKVNEGALYPTVTVTGSAP